MKREITFRGILVDNGEWVEGNLIGNDIIVGNIVDFNDEYFNTEYWLRVIPETVGQFTGLTDKNGNKIFEDDILNIKEFRNDHLGEIESDLFSIEDLITDNLTNEYTSKIEFEEGSFVFSENCEYNDTFLSCLFADDMRKSNPIFIFEVIGNIYDNPELLK